MTAACEGVETEGDLGLQRRADKWARCNALLQLQRRQATPRYSSFWGWEVLQRTVYLLNDE